MLINTIKFISDIISSKKNKPSIPTPIDASRLLWAIVPHFIYNTKANKLLTKFDDPLWNDKSNNVMDEVITYDITNDEFRETLIKKINRSKFTIVYEFGETKWRLLMLSDFKTHPYYKAERRRMLINNLI